MSVHTRFTTPVIGVLQHFACRRALAHDSLTSSRVVPYEGNLQSRSSRPNASVPQHRAIEYGDLLSPHADEARTALAKKARIKGRVIILNVIVCGKILRRFLGEDRSGYNSVRS